MTTKYVRYTHTSGNGGVLVIQQDSTGHFLDADDESTWTATPGTKYRAATESLTVPGLFEWSNAVAWPDDTYRAYWYASSALTGTTAAVAITLVSDDEPVETTSLDPQDISDALKLAPTAGAADAGSVYALIGAPVDDLATDISNIVAGGGGGAGTGSVLFTWTEYQSGHGGDPAYAVSDITVVAYNNSSATGGAVASGVTDELGQIKFYLDPGTYYLFRRKGGRSFTNPQTIVVS